ncbi:hypothetical protein MSG28_000229 [Choristoneura fumiferana]|uniref:Uncharacterized protein n=1 Tax=Choristoneura fumiferana TaxID=7141 RepID=A0ACC0JZT7_CHOFU|nr:hypothetical protein MSG28_000229 [Choristoneura fumiferana]
MYEEDDYSEENTWTYIALCGEPTLYEGLRFAKDLIIANVILRLIIHAHKEAYLSEMKSNRKALVISLHGWSGVGKNYAATMIAEALYKKGIESKDAMTVITYGPTEEQPIFANNGCKRFTKHIPYVVQKYKAKAPKVNCKYECFPPATRINVII